jgi:hypothetical protein
MLQQKLEDEERLALQFDPKVVFPQLEGLEVSYEIAELGAQQSVRGCHNDG